MSFWPLDLGSGIGFFRSCIWVPWSQNKILIVSFLGIKNDKNSLICEKNFYLFKKWKYRKFVIFWIFEKGKTMTVFSPLVPVVGSGIRDQLSHAGCGKIRIKLRIPNTGKYCYWYRYSTVVCLGFRIRGRIQIHRIHMFLGLLDPDPDPQVRGMDPDPDPDPDPSIIIQKWLEKPWFLIFCDYFCLLIFGKMM